MALDPQAEFVLGLVEKANYPELCDLEPEQARELFDATAPKLAARPENVFRVEDRFIPGPADPIPLRIYTPREPEDGERLPILVYLHGGGFVVGSLDSYDSLCRVLANRSGAIVVSVEYRLAPEHKFPAAVEDCVEALNWVAENADEFDGDSDRIAIAGDSAGGNLAAVTTIAARDDGGPALSLSVLIYPVASGTPDSYSHHAFAEKHFLTRRNILWFYEQYLNGPEEAKDPRFAPLETPDLSGLPPTLLIIAGHDPLRDEGLAYGERLRKAGVAVTVSNYEGQLHGFIHMSDVVDQGDRAIDEVCDALKEAFGATKR